MQVGDLVRYMGSCENVLGIIIDGPTNNVFDVKSWQVWWSDHRAKMDWCDDDRLEVINESSI
jgi:hypothetical protein